MNEWKPGKVRLGTERLREVTQGKRIALMMNHSALDNNARNLVDVMHGDWKCDIAFLIGMEHGVRGNLYAGDSKLEDVDERTGLKVESLYNYPDRRPPETLVASVDAVVFCAQDAGVRHWTWTPWMIYLMDAAAKTGTEVIVLDRPNPLTGEVIEGGVTREGFYSLIGAYSYPLRHGMTQGELAGMYNDIYKIGCKLSVIPFEGWERSMYYDETGLFWIPLTSNVPNMASLIGYATTGLLQNTNVNFGRGTMLPYQLVGAPWMDGADFARKLNRLDLPGVYFSDFYFTPNFYTYAGQMCYGVRFECLDRDIYSPVTVLVHMMWLLVKDYGDKFEFEDARVDRRAGSPYLRESILAGVPAEQILDNWKKESEAFRAAREPYLIYR